MERLHVVTGAARGIGLASARELSASGRVVLADRDAVALAAAAAALAGEGADVVVRACDVADGGSVQDLAAAVRAMCEADGTSLGAVVHAAGIVSAPDWRDIYRINLGGTRAASAYGVTKRAVVRLV